MPAPLAPRADMGPARALRALPRALRAHFRSRGHYAAQN